MKNKGFIYTLVIIIIAGIAITMSTSRAIDRSREQSAAAVATAQQPEAPGAADVKAEQGEAEETGVSVGTSLIRAVAGQGDGAPAYSGPTEEVTAEAEAAAGFGAEETAAEMAADVEAAVESGAGGSGADAAEHQAVAGPGANTPNTESSVGPGVQTAGSESIVGPGAESSGSKASGEQSGEASDVTVMAGPGEAGSDGVSSGTGKEASKPKSVPMSPLETAALIEEGQDMAGAKAEASAQLTTAENSYYLNRLRELDVQVQKNRQNQSVSNNYSAKKAAENELKLWDNELNVIYGEIMERLDASQASSLVDEEREWMKERDRLAAEAAKASAGGSMESVEYTISLAESTRLRAYELIELYGHLLCE